MALGIFLMGWIFQLGDGNNLISVIFICAGIAHYCVNEILYYRLHKKAALVKYSLLHKAILTAAGASLVFLQYHILKHDAELKIQLITLFTFLCFLGALLKERLIA